MSKENHLFILMGTYNGGRFLDEQIKSLQEQTYQNWKLIIRDDASNDNTTNILNTYRQKDTRIRLISDNKGNLGIRDNYNELCTIALHDGADIIFFCDQDDVWQPDKIKTHMDVFQKMTNQHGKECPILVHSDLEVVDGYLKQIHKSFLSYRGIKNTRLEPLRVLLVQNYIPACVSAINRSLLKLATPIPEHALMHDWWFALCAAASGHIGFIEKPLIRYRQHSENYIGAKGLLNIINPFQSNFKTYWQDAKYNFIQSFAQAIQLKKRIQDQNIEIHPNLMKCIVDYTNCLEEGKFKRLKSIHENGIRRQGMLYQMVFYFLLIVSSAPKISEKIT